MATVTLDTNVLPADDVLAIGRARGDDFACVSVTEREIRSHPFAVALNALDAVLPELAVWDESEWNQATWASEADGQLLKEILDVIADGSFPVVWSSLSPGQLRQLRDAMILEAHTRAGRATFVTNDVRAFISHGRRSALEALCSTSIVTPSEYLQSGASAA